MLERDRTRRLILCFCAAAVGVAVAASGASALFMLDYNGHLRGKPNSFVGFNKKRTASGKRKVFFFTSRGLPFKCDGGTTGKTEFLTLDDALPIVRGEFDGKSHVFTPQGDPVARVHGVLDQARAHGTLRLTGKLDSSDPSASCDTGIRKWVAERGPEPAS